MSDKSSIQQWKGNGDGELKVGSFMQELSAFEKSLSFETESFDIYNPSDSRMEQMEEEEGENPWKSIGNGNLIVSEDIADSEARTIVELTEDQLLSLYTLEPSDWEDQVV